MIDSVVLEKPTIVIVAEHKQRKPESDCRNSARLLPMPIANGRPRATILPLLQDVAPARRGARFFLSVMVRRWKKRERAETLKA
jgi:hypothetical protein